MLHTMKQTCEKTGLTYDTLKFYCNEGLIPNVKRDKNNYRVFNDKDIAWINSLSCLKNCGMGILEMKEYLDLCLKGEKTIPERKEIIEKSLNDYGKIIICNNLDECIKLSNLISPEHLELLIENPMEYLGEIKNAGSVFLGEYTPEPIGDYFGGTNHVLPTRGTAKFSSPLSVDTFLKKSSFLFYSKKALYEDGKKVIRFANEEGLTAHANSIRVRLENEKN